MIPSCHVHDKISKNPETSASDELKLNRRRKKFLAKVSSDIETKKNAVSLR
jgi:hypothetical protein